ncbi:DUF4394 domain-containing protein [Hymenobacter negativus]|uniref:DUF4394 domain-containing protein n=1 Tax=Hymenobacter negativus TaxID=2795026 RepID=A0ABS0Q7D2_9BACT|nr:DUF4394 domain-containing protein [Hymenobacter negativus]MBH8558387.1 DUF4394 domain-containing protein [Hymenobacter negativus]
MQHRSTSQWLAAATAGLLLLNAAPGHAQTVFGLQTSTTATNLVTFQATAPGTYTATTAITGLGTGQTLVGLDSRPNTGQLFALGYAAATTQVQLYTLNVTTGALTAVGPLLTLNLGTNTARIGFDFNPTVDRIRVTGSNNTNFRLNPNNGALAATDTNLAYATTDPNAAQTPGIGAVAYTNSYIGASATTLYDVDEANARLTTQIPPNNGTLNTVGALGFANFGSSDLDIYFNTSTGANVGYLTALPNVTPGTTNSSLYTVNLATGATTLVGAIGGNLTPPVTDIALQITRTVPATVTGNLAYALSGTNLLTFDTALPGTIRTSLGITGVAATQTLVGLDVRPFTNTLFALGYDAALATPGLNAQVYSISAVTGVATPIGSAIRLELGTGKVGFDFNPTVDRIRVTSSNRANYRLNPNDGTVAATDTQLAYATTDANAAATPNIGAVAYTNSVAGPLATATTLYNYDLSLNILTTQNPPNNGTLNTVGTSGITANATASSLDMDIYSPVAGTNTAYLVANPGTTANTNLYTVNLTTGATTLVGAIGNGLAARDIAVAGPAGVNTAVRDRADLVAGLSLYPNPTHGRTALAFNMARPGQVELSVVDALGRRVATVPSAALPAGPQELRWEAGTAKPGLYLMRLVVDGQPAATRQLVIE